MALLVHSELDHADDIGNDGLGILEANSEVICPSYTGEVFDIVGVNGFVVREAVLVGKVVVTFALHWSAI